MTGRPPVQRSCLAVVCVPPGRTQAPFQRSPADAARTSRRSTRGPGGAGTSLYAGLVTPPELRSFFRAVDHRNTPKHTREPINTPHRATRRPVAPRCASPRGDPNPPKMRRSGRVVAVSAESSRYLAEEGLRLASHNQDNGRSVYVTLARVRGDGATASD